MTLLYLHCHKSDLIKKTTCLLSKCIRTILETLMSYFTIETKLENKIIDGRKLNEILHSLLRTTDQGYWLHFIDLHVDSRVICADLVECYRSFRAVYLP